MSPGHPWLSGPGICVSDKELYGNAPKRADRKSMVCAERSATMLAFFAGSSGPGIPNSNTGASLPGLRLGRTVAVGGRSGNAFSIARAAYDSTVVVPSADLALELTYLPRLNPASGIGRSETQREISSEPFVSCSIR